MKCKMVETIKEQICDSLNGKKFDVIWQETVDYSAEIIANDIDEAKKKFMHGDVINQRVDYATLLDNTLEIEEHHEY